MLSLLFTPATVPGFHVISWNRETATMSADASDIQYRGERVIRVTSSRTGKAENFQFVKEVHDLEGDLVSRVFSGPQGLRFEVFND